MAKQRFSRIISQSSICETVQDRKFVLGAIDLHWGSSEHALDSEKRDVELQFHHFDLAFDNFEEALLIPGAVLSHAVLYKVRVFFASTAAIRMVF